MTTRQWQCLELLASGSTPKQIAVQLGISHSTVRTHLSDAYRALGVFSGTQAVTVYWEELR